MTVIERDNWRVSIDCVGLCDSSLW